MEPFEKQEKNGNAVPILYQLIYVYIYNISYPIYRAQNCGNQSCDFYQISTAWTRQ